MGEIGATRSNVDTYIHSYSSRGPHCRCLHLSLSRSPLSLSMVSPTLRDSPRHDPKNGAVPCGGQKDRGVFRMRSRSVIGAFTLKTRLPC